ncbi:MAG: hypothetical protein KBD15_02170 [Candidatus Magasanikbacteria bacterium]|nr:hypothetical protein [Candidatus Magasanikbacteria bacterium]
MKHPRSIQFFLSLLVVMVVGGYTMTHALGVLDKNYFRAHQAELTTEEIIMSPADDSVGVNYYYDKTPFRYPYQASAVLSGIIPTLFVLIVSIRYMHAHKTKKRFVESLVVPLAYGALNGAFFFAFVDKALGWEYYLGLQITLIHFAFVFGSILLVNGVFLLRQTKAQ